MPAGDIAGALRDSAKTELEQAKASGDQAAIDAAQTRVDTWSEGGAGKTLLHGLAGAGMAALGGGNVLQGVTGAVANQLASNAMRDHLVGLGYTPGTQDALALATKDKPDPKTDGLTRLQRFFAGYALSWRSKDTPESLKVQLASDPHAPARFRTNGPLTQLPAFAQAFDCKPGQPMVRAADKQVVIW